MNATEVENPPRLPVLEQARIVSDLLKEYGKKLSTLNADILHVLDTTRNSPLARHTQRAAWLMDQSELLRKPLSNIISQGSALLEYSSPNALAKFRDAVTSRENSYLDSLTADELALRMREIEIHHHHLLRLTHELRQALETAKEMEQVKKLRLAAGLNAMKGGPLDPN